MPCSRGSVPVSKVACAAHVTAGKTVVIGRANPSAATREMCGVCVPSISCVSPTTLMTTKGRFMSGGNRIKLNLGDVRVGYVGLRCPFGLLQLRLERSFLGLVCRHPWA